MASAVASVAQEWWYSKPFFNPAIGKGRNVRVCYCLNALQDDNRNDFINMNNTMTLPNIKLMKLDWYSCYHWNPTVNSYFYFWRVLLIWKLCEPGNFFYDGRD